MKTPEEIKKALECCSKAEDYVDCMWLDCPYAIKDGYNCVCQNKMGKDALEYIEVLEDYYREIFERMPKWVSVKERLPENGGGYLCCLNSEFRTICYFDGGQWDDSENAYVTHLVTHWIPLPNLPKEDCNV